MNSARSGSIERFYFISPWGVISKCFAHTAFAIFLKLERLMHRVALEALALFNLGALSFSSKLFNPARLSISLIGVDFIYPLMILRPVF